LHPIKRLHKLVGQFFGKKTKRKRKESCVLPVDLMGWGGEGGATSDGSNEIWDPMKCQPVTTALPVEKKREKSPPIRPFWEEGGKRKGGRKRERFSEPWGIYSTPLERGKRREKGEIS